MKQRFNKKITTTEQIAIFEELKSCEFTRSQIKQMISDKFIEYRELEGKYANGKQYDKYADPHFRPYYYTYASVEEKQKEDNERQKFYDNIIRPLKLREEELSALNQELNNKLCIALWGYDIDMYYLQQRLKSKQTEIQALQIEIIEIQEQIAIKERETK